MCQLLKHIPFRYGRANLLYIKRHNIIFTAVVVITSSVEAR